MTGGGITLEAYLKEYGSTVPVAITIVNLGPFNISGAKLEAWDTNFKFANDGPCAGVFDIPLSATTATPLRCSDANYTISPDEVQKSPSKSISVRIRPPWQPTTTAVIIDFVLSTPSQDVHDIKDNITTTNKPALPADTPCTTCKKCLAVVNQLVVIPDVSIGIEGSVLASSFLPKCTGNLTNNDVVLCKKVAAAIAGSYNGNLGKRAGALCSLLGQCVGPATSAALCNITTDKPLDLCTQEGYQLGTPVKGTTTEGEELCCTHSWEATTVHWLSSSGIAFNLSTSTAFELILLMCLPRAAS